MPMSCLFQCMTMSCLCHAYVMPISMHDYVVHMSCRCHAFVKPSMSRLCHAYVMPLSCRVYSPFFLSSMTGVLPFLHSLSLACPPPTLLPPRLTPGTARPSSPWTAVDAPSGSHSVWWSHPVWWTRRDRHAHYPSGSPQRLDLRCRHATQA